MGRSATAAFAVVTAVLSAVAAPAAASTPQIVGQAATTTLGGCAVCVAAQFGDSGTSSYVIPSDGVLTLSRFYVGPYTEGGDEWVKAGTFRRTDATHATVISEGEKHIVTGVTPAGQYSYLERIHATAGDVLGGQFKTSPFIEATPHIFTTAATADEVGIFTGEPGVGETFAASVGTSDRVNMLAVLESDEDGDGYGDFSQDLCPGSLVATSACSGSLFGSNLQGSRSTIGACGYSCLRVQKTIGGSSTAAPFDGVVVRWRVLNASPGEYSIRVVDPNGANTYSVLRSSAPGTVTSTGSPLISQISTFQTRLPIPAGAYVGLVPPALSSSEGFQTGGSSTYGQANDNSTSGSTIPETATVPGTVLYDADIEPDADHDGYGDITQDACPTNPATQGACPPPTSASTGHATDKPRISTFRAKPKRFHFKRSAKLLLRLTAAATVTFTTERKARCKPRGKSCRSWRRVYSFKRQLPEGHSTVAYSGSYRKHGKRHWLAPGNYRISAVADNSAGSGPAARTGLQILDPS